MGKFFTYYLLFENLFMSALTTQAIVRSSSNHHCKQTYKSIYNPSAT